MLLPCPVRSAIIDNLFFVLGDEGDGVLIPAPYYPAFDNDLKVGGTPVVGRPLGCETML